MYKNYKREIYGLAHLNLSTASFKYLSQRIYVILIINKHLIFAVLQLWLIQLPAVLFV